MAAPGKSTAVELQPLKLETIKIPIIGESGMICHAWSQKAKQQMLDKQMKKASKGKEAKDPWADFCDSLYWLSDKPEKPTEADVEAGRFGFPAVAFKSAAITAVTTVGSMTKVLARQCFHLVGEHVEILGPPPSMREDMCRVGMGTADIRHRAEFETWGAILTVQLNANAMSAEQVIQLFQLGGFGVGIGDWRAEKDGVAGRFRIALDGEELPCR